MTWFLLALGSAITDAFNNLFVKKQTSNIDALSLSCLLSLVVSIMFLPFLGRAPEHLSTTFWVAILIRTMLDTLAGYLLIKSIQLTDLSLSIPLTAFTPIFIVFFEFIFTGSLPTLLGILGIILITLGVYLLNISSGEKFLTPFKNVFKNEGTFLMLCVGLIWSVTSTLHRIAIGESNPYFYVSLGSILLFISSAIVLLVLRQRNAFSFLSMKNVTQTLPAAFMAALTSVMQMTAQSLFLASYVIAVKRSSILFTTILSGIFLKESIKTRIFPTVLILIGILTLLLTK